MKSRLLTITLTAAAFTSALPGSAQTVDAFPGMWMPQQTAAERVIKRAPLNQEHKLGKKVFGTSYIDFNRARSFVNYYSNSYDLERLNPIYGDMDTSEMKDLYVVNAGAYHPEEGCYYAYKVKYYTIGITYAYQWLKVDPTNGQWEVLATLENHSHDHTFLYDMAYCPYDGEMYGLVQNDNGEVKSRIGLMNLTNSEVTDLIQLDEYYFAIAFDYEGILYGIRWDYDGQGIIQGTRLDTYDTDFKLTSSKEIKVNGSAYKSYYQHGLDFDYTTGDLIWAATNNEGAQKMVRINPDNGETHTYGNVGFNECMIGLYVPYTTAQHREAPALVTDMSFTIDPNGENNVTLTWTNPTTRWNRTPLTDLQSVVIYRDSHSGSPVGTVDATGQEGKQMSFTDKGATQGAHKYYIMGVNPKGEGVETYIEAYVGRDVPGQVNDLKVKAINGGKGVEVTWAAPTIGDSEGWFDTNLTYDIERLPDHKQMATGQTSTTYTDADIEEAQYYSYVITPVSVDGRGTPRTSDGVLAGGSLKVPFSTDFSSAAEAARFTSFDDFGVRNIFEYTNNIVNPGSMCMRYYYSNGSSAVLSSPRMNLTKGKKYRVDWNITLGRYGHTFEDVYHHFRIMGGTDATPQAMTTVLADYDNFLSERMNESFVITSYFESPVDGDYCVGFHPATENRKDDFIYVTAFSITESPDNDLAVTGMLCPTQVSSSDHNVFEVNVYNNGANTQNNYKVEVGISRLDGVFVPFASTSDVPSVAAYETQVVRVTGKPGTDGLLDLAARVVLEGDGNEANNMSDLYTVNVAEGPAFNYHAVDRPSTWEDTHLPISFYSSNSTSQTIYTADMLNFIADENQIAGLAWEYDSDKDIDNVRLQVYLSTTTNDMYNANRAKMITDGCTLVYDGVVSLEEGPDHWLAISFPDKAYKIAKDQNLVVTVFAQEEANNGSFPVRFNVFNSGSASPSADKLVHSLTTRAETKTLDELNGASVFTWEVIPVLHVALKDDVDVDNVFMGSDNVNVRVFNNQAFFSGNVVVANVYDMNGRMLRSIDVKDRNSVALNLGKGIYMLKAKNAQGAVKVVKFIVG